MHLTRYYMYHQIATALGGRLSGKILGVSGIHNFYGLIDRQDAHLLEVEYPEVDMQSLPFGNEEFDVVISDQVIEHLPNPQKAIEEAFRVLKKGGIGIHTSCFLNPVHPAPSDYYRFTREGLMFLCSSYSEIIQMGSWGNRIVLVLLFFHDAFRFMRIPERPGIRKWLASYNESKYPIVTWIIARKRN
jgi:SAM-dependent methyltransferase